MTISKLHTLNASGLIALTLALGSVTHADVVELLNGDTLTGKITAMSEDTATIESPVSIDPLEINSSAIKQIKFPEDEEGNSISHPELITLSNGDTLPCRVLSMSEKTLKISTWYAGDFSIARENIRSLRFGLSEERDIYTGGDPTTKWDTTQGSWSHSGGTYTSKNSGVLARELAMPENVRIRFALAWKETPNFVFRFCAESDSATRKQDTYELTFNTAGMQIRRYQGIQQFAPIVNIGLRPHDIERQKIHIDLRLNRTAGSLSLYIDGKNAGTWHDDFETAEGNYIIFNNRSSGGTSCIISDIRISDWNDGSPSRHFSKIGQTKADVVIDSEGDKISGKIAGILTDSNKRRTIQFNGDHSPKPLMIPDRRVSILYFAESENLADFPQSVFTANLDGYGTMQLEQPRMENNKIVTHHPILGVCILDPKIIASITQSKEPAKK